jgi:glucose/mannose transport system permease protein
MFLSQNLGQGFAASTMMLLAVLIVLVPWAYHGIRRQET